MICHIERSVILVHVQRWPYGEPDKDFVASVLNKIQFHPSKSHLAQLLVVEGEHARVLTIKLHLTTMFTMLTKTMTMIALRKNSPSPQGEGWQW